MAVVAVAAVVIALMMANQDSGETAPSPSPTAAADPYEEWLERAPSDAPSLSRDDALARATLGCGQNWPPGTTDAILAEVYAEVIDC